LLATYSASPAAHRSCEDILYQLNCTVELLIRVPLLLYALMGGANFTSNTLVSAVQTGFIKLDWNTGIAYRTAGPE